MSITYEVHGDQCSQWPCHMDFPLYICNDQCRRYERFANLIRFRVFDYYWEVVIGNDSISQCIAKKHIGNITLVIVALMNLALNTYFSCSGKYTSEISVSAFKYFLVMINCFNYWSWTIKRIF